MSIIDDVLFAKRLSSSLNLFKEKDSYHFEFRCPVCGDSQKNKYVTRGTLYPNKSRTGLRFGCYNCGGSGLDSNGFGDFLKFVDYNLFKEWLFERWKTKNEAIHAEPVDRPSIRPLPIFDGLVGVDDLPLDHPVNRYLDSRFVPKLARHDFRWTDNFSLWANSILPDRKMEVRMEEPRIVFPLISEHGIEFGFQGRVINDDLPFIRYISRSVDRNFTKAYGMHLITRSKPVYVLEGVFDSSLFPNAIAALDSDLGGRAKLLGLDPNNSILIFDNEPKNPDVMRNRKKAIELGFWVAIWPEWAKQHGKDVSKVYEVVGDRIVLELMESAKKSLSAKLFGVRR